MSLLGALIKSVHGVFRFRHTVRFRHNTERQGSSEETDQSRRTGPGRSGSVRIQRTSHSGRAEEESYTPIVLYCISCVMHAYSFSLQCEGRVAVERRARARAGPREKELVLVRNHECRGIHVSALNISCKTAFLGGLLGFIHSSLTSLSASVPSSVTALRNAFCLLQTSHFSLHARQ
jgi:hypothetical protein